MTHPSADSLTPPSSFNLGEGRYCIQTKSRCQKDTERKGRGLKEDAGKEADSIHSVEPPWDHVEGRKEGRKEASERTHVRARLKVVASVNRQISGPYDFLFSLFCVPSLHTYRNGTKMKEKEGNRYYKKRLMLRPAIARTPLTFFFS
mmetsp:Transcript_18711/g.37840  ORF Transcript_18711/g.37840 Transcript_18711/m.37840 type:complete len:147 (-) Transcript_18711:150-590(-)